MHEPPRPAPFGGSDPGPDPGPNPGPDTLYYRPPQQTCHSSMLIAYYISYHHIANRIACCLEQASLECWQPTSRMAINSASTPSEEDIILANAAPPAETITTQDITQDITQVDEPLPEWKPGRQEYLILISLSIISLMVALDASIVAPALTVSHPSLLRQSALSSQYP